jgi:hypothetical protein
VSHQLPNDGTNSGDDIPLFAMDNEPQSDFDYFKAPDDASDIVDAIVIEEPKSRIKSDPGTALDRDAKSGVPNIDEWMDFFSRILIRLSTDWYVEWAFRGIDEDLLSDREVDRIKLTKEQRDRMARPFAELSFKNKFTRKHGREIIATAGTIDAVAQLGVWFSQVNRIAAKYRKLSGQQPQQEYRPANPVSRRDRLPNGKPVPVADDMTGGEHNERTEQGPESSNGHRERPDILGAVYNPGS